MKRLMFLLASAIAIPAFSFVATPKPGDRIGVLRMGARFEYRSERIVAATVQNDLRDELQDLGFNAFDAGVTYDQLMRSGPPNDADYYVEVLSGDAAGRPVGGVGAGIGNVAVEVGVVVSHVAAQVRLYDARTLNAVDTYDLEKSSTAVLPTGIGIAGRSLWAAVVLPFVQYGQYRVAAHEVAHQAALRIGGR